MNAVVHKNYVFEGFSVDFVRGCLMRDGEELKLRPKSFNTLVYLVENSGRLISKEELIDAVWPDVAVTDDSLVQCLIEIRKAFGGNAQRYIKTVPRRGYIFDAPVSMNGRNPDAAKERGDEVDSVKPVDNAATTAHGPSVSPQAPSHLIRLRDNKKAVATLILAVTMLGVGFYRVAFDGQLMSGDAEFRSMAVLPFREIDGDSGVSGIGMTDTLITKLSGVKDLIVRSTSAVIRYGKSDQDPVAAGQEQGVDAVLDGTLRKSGESIRVSVQLLRVKDGKILWADTFINEKYADIFTVEDSIAQRVVEKLRLRLNRKEQERLTKHYTRDVGAYELYLKGNEHFHQNTRAGNLKAVEYYERAIGMDPEFALAHVALARIYFEPSSPLPRAESEQRAESELRAALKLDNNLAEAHALIGEMNLDEQDYSSAEWELRLAMDLDPKSDPVLGAYWRYLLLMGNYNEAIAVGQMQTDLDPLSPIKKGIVPYILIRAGRCDEALERFQKVHREDPLYIPAVNNIGIAYICKGMYKEAAGELEQTVPVQEAPERGSFAVLAFAYAKSGRKEKAEEMLLKLQDISRSRYIDPMSFVTIYAGLGDNDRAFQWLEKGFDDRSGPPYLYVHAVGLDVLRSDPRWAEFARRKGFAL